MKKMSPLPSFLPSNALPDDTPITGFIGVPGTGVSPHLDETCDTLMTAQVKIRAGNHQECPRQLIAVFKRSTPKK